MWIVMFILGILVGAMLALPLMFMDSTETFKAIDKKIADKIKEM